MADDLSEKASDVTAGGDFVEENVGRFHEGSETGVPSAGLPR